jgi:hypothetical protein
MSSDRVTFISNRGGFDAGALGETDQRTALPEETAGAEETAPARSPSEPVETTPWAYGPPATTARDSNFISDENLLLWLAQKQDGLYGELRDNMDMSRERSKLMEDLAHLQAGITGGSITRDNIAEELRPLLDAYAGTPLGRELEETFGPMLATLAEGGEPGSFQDTIQGTIDALGRDDQLALIEIQSLTADIREAAQLASNLLSSSNQAASSIVGNIAR